jgi:hypothetical protein
MFSRKSRSLAVVEPSIELSPETLAPTESPSVVDLGLGLTEKLLRDLTSKKATLISEIAERQKKLRETEAALEAFQLADAKLTAFNDEPRQHLHSANSNAADGPEAA